MPALQLTAPARAVSKTRWSRVLSIAWATFAIEGVIAWLSRSRLDGLAHQPLWLVALPVIAAVAILQHLGLRRFWAATGVQHLVLYPPAWFGVLVGTLAAATTINQVDIVYASFRATPTVGTLLDCISLATAVAGGAAIIVSGAMTLRAHYRRDPWLPADVQVQEAAEKVDLRFWLSTEEPLSSVSLDLFEFGEIARRMAARLARRNAPAQALLGRLGSGKTTVRNFVKAHMRRHYPNAPIEFVDIELWPYETPSAAVDGILRAVIGSLSRFVHTSQLDGLPAAYANAIAKAAGFGKWFPDRPKTRRTPTAMLEELDGIAALIGVRIVLWVEDLERFAFGDPGAAEVEASELERLAPIRALLFGLDRLESITVVTATTNLFQRFDLEKVARYVERLSELSPSAAKRVLTDVRAEWMSGDPYIDPAGSARRDLGYDTSNDELVSSFFGDRVHNLATATATLASTPRVLKQGLRRCDEAWQRLRGEIDLDELLAMSMLRESDPDVFALIDKNIDGLRGSLYSARREGADPLGDILAQITELRRDDRRLPAVEFILRHIIGKDGWRPQGLRQTGHADYWQRFETIPEVPARISDQQTLRVLVAPDDDKIVDLLGDPARSGTVEDFDRVLPSQRIERLFLPLVRRRLDDDPSTWEDQRIPPGLIPLWRMIRDRGGSLDLDRLAMDVETGLGIAAKKNLALLEEITHWMATRSAELPDLFPAEIHDHLNARTRELLRDTYTGKPEALASSLKNASPLVLFWLN